ncbi:MAG: hypothetical protein ACK5KR_02570 [Breznakia sp.]
MAVSAAGWMVETAWDAAGKMQKELRCIYKTKLCWSKILSAPPSVYV